MTDKETAFKKISELVNRFEEQYESYIKAEYNETLTRRDFIDPFFKALGWDIDNENGYAESYREVIHEDKVKVGKATKAPDYSFRLPGGKRLFFVEAKKPFVTVKDEIQPAYQVRRYGWSARLPISIITDFEEFSVYDCTKKPKPTDKASVARIKYLTFREYLTEFEFLWDTFSKERVLKGSFDKFVQSDTLKKGTATVDKAFLQSLDNWRTYLATSISWNNKELEEDEINFVVQQTIDRIIFLRIAEDRGVEPENNMAQCIKSGNYYSNLYNLFLTADEKYNSGLFDLRKDEISKIISVDNKVIKNIVEELYYPKCEYAFDVLPVEILGTAYEQFLGKVIRITPAHHAKIEEKSEVRKAGGVYYTPQYVVDYIVQNTVGKLIEGKSPKEVSHVKILDPACGSGSFLLGAYQYLLDWHKNYYNSIKAGTGSKGRKEDVLRPDGNLTTAEKKRILLNNIYGVDIDVNAVEVSKLSLLLKCMEGETEASINQQLRLFNERILPTLDNNIKCGNSLVDTDFYDNQLDFGEEKKIKPFNWQKAFPQVFNRKTGNYKKEELLSLAQKAKLHAAKAMEYAQELENRIDSITENDLSYGNTVGFDVIIGNPPWVDIKGHPSELIKYYFDKYLTTENRVNLYAIFVERGLQLLNLKGKLGFIIPSSILYQSSYKELRKLILEKWGIEKIVRLPDNTFHFVKAESLIITIGKNTGKTECIIYNRKDIINEITYDNVKKIELFNAKDFLQNDFFVFNIFTNNETVNILKKTEYNKTHLQDLCDFSLGITPYDKYKGHTKKQIDERVFHSSKMNNDTFKPVLEGADVSRFLVVWSGKEYISYGKWLGAPREKRFFTNPRILVRQIVSGNPLRIYAGYTDEELYNTQSIFNIIIKETSFIDLKYILAILNSNLMNYYHSNKYLDLSKNLFQKILIQNCKRLPIKVLNFEIDKEKSIHDEIIKYVTQLLSLYKAKKHTSLVSNLALIQTKIDYCEDRINEMVYQIYGLTNDEIKIIEGNNT